MNITDWNNDEIMRLVMAKGHILREKNGIEIPQSTFSCKISRNGLKLSEFQQICNILGYDISLQLKKR